jgi:outer membrane protein assembly factor BamE (lipoprotein component of BamABCDE complex)
MKRKALAAVVLLLVALMMAGCARRLVGSPIREENVSRIAVGKTTRTEILQMFGSPYQIESKDDKEVLFYLYGHEWQATFILYTERRQEADILTVYINRAGVVSDYAFSKDVASPELLKQPLFPRP